MEEVKILSYPSHYEIYNYTQNTRLESALSYYDKVLSTKHEKFVRIKNTMYVPKGIDKRLMTDTFDVPILPAALEHNVVNVDFQLFYPPRNKLQEESIRFFTGQKEYSYTKTETQLVLSLPTEEGKTYVTIASLAYLKVKSLIIVNRNILKQQWFDRAKQYTNMTDENICIISSSEQFTKLLNKDDDELQKIKMYICSHGILRNLLKADVNYVNEIFNKLGIGVKVYDEAHLEWENILFIDYFTNIPKTLYLSATYTQSDYGTNKVFQTAFYSVYKFAKYNEEREPHTKAFLIKFNSRGDQRDIDKIYSNRGMYNSCNYIDYGINNGTILIQVKEILKLIITKDMLNGQIFIISAKMESCDLFHKLVRAYFCDTLKSISYHTKSKNQLSKNLSDLSDYDVVCVTSKMLGTGPDINTLQIIIDTEPMSSKRNILQKFGRLRERRDENNNIILSWYFALFDFRVPTVLEMYKITKKVLLKAPTCESITLIDNLAIEYE